MASASSRRWTDLLTCRQVLNIMVILGFMFNYMLRVNLTIAIVDMVVDNGNSTSANVTNSTSTGHPRFAWDTQIKNDILGSFFWGYILTELPGGRMAEIVGARKIFGGGMLAASVLTILTPASCHIHHYAVIGLRAVLGFFLGATWPAILPMAAKWIPPMERSKFIANMMASSLGAAITLPVCGFLISSLGWPSVFYFTGAIGLIWSILWFVLVFDSPAEHPRITEEERTEIETKIADGEGGKGVKPSTVPWVRIFTSLPVWAIVITHGCSVFGYFTVVNQLPTYMKDVLHFNIKNNGLLSSLPYLGKYLMAIIASWLADKLRRSGKLSTTVTRKVFTTFALLVPAVLMIIQAIWGENSALSVTAGYLSNGLDIAPNFSGTIFGMANTLSSLGGWVSTQIVAVLTKESSTFDTWKFVFWILVFTYAFGCLFYLIFGTGKLQTFNSVEAHPKDDKELQPLKSKAELDKEKEILA
ncbi:sialin isoform X2 [Anoplophora glabripennis]|uniref:sialin isoform X2 n=1 Tax=Anoplophora glabripennis TaxID=217634 RepID=UPI0008749B5B|nr:sialin isoform X2 [Anoplophora glabripennis]